MCVCRSPASQRRPSLAGRDRRAGRSDSGGGPGSWLGSRFARLVVTSADTLYLAPSGGTWWMADDHLPGARFQFARQVAGGGAVRGNDERLAGPAGPAAEPRGTLAAQVEHGPAPVVLQLNAQRVGPGRDFHGR